MFISKKHYNKIMTKLNEIDNKVEKVSCGFEQHKEQQKTNFENVNKKLVEVEKMASKRYVSDNFSEKKEKSKSWNQIMDEYLNGENKNDKGGN